MRRASETSLHRARRLKFQCLKLYGFNCMFCHSVDINYLEFAHIRKTKVMGRNRGNFHRYYDVLKHPDCYMLLCRNCHFAFDHGEITMERYMDYVYS